MSKEEKRKIFDVISRMSEQAQVALAAGLAIKITMDDSSEEPESKPEEESMDNAKG